MSDVVIVSTTDTPEQVLAAQGREAKPDVQEDVETKSAEAKGAPETLEASEASNDESETQADSEEESTQAPKKKSGIEKKISKLTKQRTEARAEAEYWKKEALKSQSAPAAPAAAKPEAIQSGKPQAADFDTHDAYVEALADWKVEQKLSAKEAKTREAEAQTEQQRQLKSHFDRVATFSKAHDDFDEVIAEIGDAPMSLAVQHVIVNSDNGPALMYELAKSPEEYKRICELPAIQAARELGKIEARLAESKKPEIKTSKAPKPVSPVSRVTAASSKDPADMNYDEFKAWREQSLRG